MPSEMGFYLAFQMRFANIWNSADRDLMQVMDTTVLGAKVVGTWVGGKKVY